MGVNTHPDRLAATIAPLARGPGGAVLRSCAGDQDVLHHWDGARLLVMSPPGRRLPAAGTVSLLVDLEDRDGVVLEVRGELRPQEPRQWRLAWLLALIRRHGMGDARTRVQDRGVSSGDIAHLDANHAAITVVDGK